MRPGSVALALGAVVVLALALLHSAEVRARADAALGRGMPAREAALARGFVLGEDDGIDAETKESFRRSGLSHLVAVSGQNVALLALLAMPLLAAFGIPLRARLGWVLGLIALYVPLTGAGPSIQRAGVMGALGVFATLAGRRASRLYALAIAAVVTLAIDPGIGSDVGWQLSFAAVLGILVIASPLREAISNRLGLRGPLGRTLAEGAALTFAATLATAPLIAFHFGELSTVTLLANLLVLPAVAPAMWLGMLSAAAGQVPGLPVEAINYVDSLLLGYIAEVAAWCGRPGWACLQVRIGLGGLAASYGALALACAFVWLASRRRAVRRVPRRTFRASRRRLVGMCAAAVGVLALLVGGSGGGAAAGPVSGLRVSVLDVGQGDAILFQPAGSPSILVDGGPPGDGLASLLRDAGVGGLGAAVITHDQSDHAGGIVELLGTVPISRLAYGAIDRRTRTEAGAAGVGLEQVAAGSRLRSGRLRLDVIWPPPVLLSEESGQGGDPNLLALVMVARWGRFSMLLTADAEAESTPIDPGPVDVLKLAHHGSEDAGLDALLDRVAPRLAVISVGADNPYGHPTPSTLATLAAHGVRTLRTDLDGTVEIDVGRDSIEVSGGN